MDHPRPWLRYVNAAELDDKTNDFDGLDVTNGAGEKLGRVDGFVVDVASGRPYYVVVDSGGWFKSKQYLVPVGHAQLDGGRKTLATDLSRERIERFPGFDKDVFAKLSDEELEKFDYTLTAVCCPADPATTSAQRWSDARSHYAQPDWW